MRCTFGILFCVVLFSGVRKSIWHSDLILSLPSYFVCYQSLFIALLCFSRSVINLRSDRKQINSIYISSSFLRSSNPISSTNQHLYPNLEPHQNENRSVKCRPTTLLVRPHNNGSSSIP